MATYDGGAMTRVSDASTTTQKDRKSKTNPWRIVAAVLMVAVGIGILSVAMSGSEATNRDYTEYWAVGHQLVHRGNPYDAASILLILQAAGSKATEHTHMILRNPPSALFITLPLGFVSVTTGAVVWSLALIAALMASIRMLWIMHDRPEDRLHLIGYMFPPVLACLLAGQLGIFLLLGVTLFIYFQKSKPYLAGTALMLCALKPHLFMPFGMALIVWMGVRKDYRVLIGAGAAVLASTGLILCLDPAVFLHYAHGEKGENIQALFIPCMSVLFRVVLHRSAVWLQFLPMFVGCVWAIWYFSTRRARWSWLDHGPLLLLVSVLVAPYAWFTDESILLPAILAGLYRASNAGRSLLTFGCIAGVALIEVLAGVPLPSGFYMWTAPAWLAWYLYAVRTTSSDVAGVGECKTHNELVTSKLGQLKGQKVPADAE